MKKHICRIALAAALALAAATAQAEGGGDAELTIADAKHAFALFAKQSDWSGSPQFASVSMSLVPKDADTRKKYGGFHLGFELSGNTASNPEARFSRRTGGFRPEMLYAQDKPKSGGLTVKIDSLAVDGTLLKISGNFDSKVGPSKNYGRDIDLDAAIPVSGTFSVTLERLKH